MPARRTAILNPEHAAYLAGLVDGEGTIALTRIHRGQNRHLVVAISNTERPLLEWVLAKTGVGKITTKRTTVAHHAPGYTYAVSSRQALALLAQIEPYLQSHKAARARLALHRYLELTPRNGKYAEDQLAARHEFEREFAAIRVRRVRARPTGEPDGTQRIPPLAKEPRPSCTADGGVPDDTASQRLQRQ